MGAAFAIDIRSSLTDIFRYKLYSKFISRKNMIDL